MGLGTHKHNATSHVAAPKWAAFYIILNEDLTRSPTNSNFRTKRKGGSTIDRFTLDRERTVLSIVDIQERLVRAMDEQVYTDLAQNVIRLVKGAGILGVPVLTTQQYTKGLGETMPEIKEHLKEDHIEKTTFSSWGSEEYRDRLAELSAKSVVIVGMETHICVLQTTLDLIREGFAVHVVVDAVMSRKRLAWKTALNLMEKAGAVITVTETVLFQLLTRSDDPDFKEVSRLVK